MHAMAFNAAESTKSYEQKPENSEILNNQVLSYRALCSQTAGFLVFPSFKSRMGDRALSYQTLLLWKQLPVWI